jgi:hypothetical protein
MLCRRSLPNRRMSQDQVLNLKLASLSPFDKPSTQLMGQSKISIGLSFLLLLKSRHITTETQSMEMPMIRRNRDFSRPNFNQSNPKCATRCASCLKTNLAHALRVMAPALFGLTFASVAHAQGTMNSPALRRSWERSREYFPKRTCPSTLKPISTDRAPSQPTTARDLGLSNAGR